MWTDFDKHCMQECLRQAEAARDAGEVPVGAVLAREGRIVASARNEMRLRSSPIAHAEMLVLQRGAEDLGRFGLLGTTLYVTLEPCVMCAGALVGARVEALVFGTRDDRFGGCRSVYRITEDLRLNHRLRVREGLLAESCSSMLVDFFRERRLQ
jgi:tRNA(adenine34) deaminase